MLSAGGTENHVHLLVSLGKTVAVSQLLLEIKRDSSAWVNKREPTSELFRWQEGYGAFAIVESNPDALKRCIAGQKEHHRTISFEDEFRALLRKISHRVRRALRLGLMV